MTLALHRKYRPQKVSQLDQTKVRQVFEAILKSGKFSQTYLFTGPKGTGKTSAARILAKIVNCEVNAAALMNPAKNRSLQEPCNTCSACTEIIHGNSTTVVEMDAASNRGIDDIRTLRDQISLVPVNGLYSVYIIDEVHMLTTEAFNALLKTLEEPPQHAIFCLATTELHKLPETVISRCTVVAYQKSTQAELTRALKRVVKGEQLKVDDQVLDLIASQADGSFRDAVNLIQQLIALGQPLTSELVTQHFQVNNSVFIQQWVEQIIQHQTAQALAQLDEQVANNVDLKALAKGVISFALLQVETEIKQNQRVPQEYLDLVEIFSQSYKRFAEVPIAELALEMAVIEYGLKSGPIKTHSVSNPQKPPAKKEPINREPEPVATPAVAVPEVTLPEKPKTTASKTVEVVEPQGQVTLDIDQVLSHWPQVLDQISSHNHGIVTVLKRGKVAECQGNTIILNVSYAFHKQQLEQERYLTLIEKCLGNIFGGQVKLTVKLSQSKLSADMVAHHNVSGTIPPKDTELVEAVEEIFGV